MERTARVRWSVVVTIEENNVGRRNGRNYRMGTREYWDRSDIFMQVMLGRTDLFLIVVRLM